MKFIIDRFEGDSAVIEINFKMLIVPRDIIPNNAIEGSCIETRVVKNPHEEKIKDLMDDLFQ